MVKTRMLSTRSRLPVSTVSRAACRSIEGRDKISARSGDGQKTEQVIRVVKPGFVGADDFVLALFGRFEPMIANIYIGLAERACDLAIERVKKKNSVAEMTRSMAHHPEVQHAIADIVIELDGMIAHADRIADDWTNDVDHGALWPAELVAAKYHCVEGAFRALDLAMDVSGGGWNDDPVDGGRVGELSEAGAAAKDRGCLGSVFGATTCTGWKDDRSDRCTNEMPAFESRWVRIQPLTATGASFGASPARIPRMLNSLLPIGRSH
jgi:acyl-CoA dehydrogenase-like protein